MARKPQATYKAEPEGHRETLTLEALGAQMAEDLGLAQVEVLAEVPHRHEMAAEVEQTIAVEGQGKDQDKGQTEVQVEIQKTHAITGGLQIAKVLFLVSINPKSNATLPEALAPAHLIKKHCFRAYSRALT